MATPIVDPAFNPGCYVFGYSLPGHAYFGRARTYNQQAIFGARPFGGEIPGKNTENDVFAFRYGSPNPKSPYWYKGAWHTSPNPWPVTPDMSVNARGAWAKRMIHYVWRGKPRVRRYTPDSGAAKEYLVPTMLKLMESSFLYSCLTDEAKARLKHDARVSGLATQGHNYFTKLYIQDNPKWMTYV